MNTASQTAEIQRLTELATAARNFLEPRWRAWKEEFDADSMGGGKPLSRSMCFFSSVFLAKLLKLETGEEFIVEGGSEAEADDVDEYEVDPDRAPGGMLDQEGLWNGHYWVTDGFYSYIIDITADQFGWPKVLVIDSDDHRYRNNYRGEAIENRFGDVEHRVAGWIEEWAAARAGIAP